MLSIKKYQLLASLSASLVFISDGMFYGWSSLIIPLLYSDQSPVRISKDDETWLEAIFLMTGVIGLPATAYLADKIGRRKSLLLASFVSVLGWTLISVANSVIYLYAGRFLGGLTSNLIFVTGPMYISEISDKKIRGLLTGLVYIMMLIEFVIIYTLGPFLPFYLPPLVGAAILVLQLMTLWFMPNSPTFSVAKGKWEEARTDLRKLTGKEDCEEELDEIVRTINEHKCEEKNTLDVIFQKHSIKVFVIVTVLHFSQHFSGVSVVFMNLHPILAEANSEYFSPEMSGILFAVLMLLAVVICSFLVDKWGRKNFLIISSVLTGFCLFGLAVYFHIKSLGLDLDFADWVPFTSVMFYAAVFNVGLGMIPKVMASELFPAKIKSVGMTYGDATFVGFGSLSVICYKYSSNAYGIHVPFYFFTGVSFAVALFTAMFIPETKGKSLEEIQVVLRN